MMGGPVQAPLSSVKYAGVPWELGLAETHQTLRANDLRDKVPGYRQTAA